ncbi:MAG TPA: YCF48-related protein, partial [Polyangiaceae bacterium]|nr:YCF48-related protein [Polyangiaceae bacterium]
MTWSSKSVGAAPLYSVACLGNIKGWVAGAAGLVTHTEDGGATWTNEDSHLTADLLTVRFGASDLGVVAGRDGALAVSHDEGATWTTMT